MSSDLQACHSTSARFRATFVRYGIKSAFYGPDRITMFLCAIINLHTNTLVTDFLWVTGTQDVAALADLCPGDELEFDARLWFYDTGHQSDNEVKPLVNSVATTNFARVSRHGNANGGE